MKKTGLTIIALVLCFCSITNAQEIVVREQTGANVVFFECHYVVHDSINRVLLAFRIRYDFFVFTRKFTNDADSYSANGEVVVELIDSTETSVARQIYQVNLKTVDNAPPSLKTQFIQNLFTHQLPSGRYRIVFKIEDKESRRQFIDEKNQIVIPKTNGMLSSLIPVQKQNGDLYTLFNLAGDVFFSQNYGFVLVSKKILSTATYSLRKLQIDEDEKESIETNVPATLEVFENKTVSASLSNRSIESSFSDQSNSNAYYIALNGSHLRQGRYEIEFTFPDSSKIKTTFGARWLDMPTSLSDLDIATEPIQFIITKDEYSDLRRGGRETRIKKFDEFWKKKDTTPETAYNEVMHEFYRRVDFAFTAFRTYREMNGAITDRGKIYILYGKPSSTERMLNPGGAPKEIWKYSSQNKTFTFEDPSRQGNYKLAENK